MWARHTQSKLVFLILTSLQTVSISSPVFHGDKIFAAVGDSVTFPCLMNSPKHTPITRINGRWTWRGGASNAKPTVILQFISGMIPSLGKSDLNRRSHVSSYRSSGTFSLTVKNVQPGDAGQFECDFHFSPYNARAVFQLFIVTVTSNTSRPSIQGDSVALTCRVPGVPVKWTGPGGTGERQENPLALPNVGIGQAGQWTCHVVTATGHVTARHILDVIGFTSPADEITYVALGSSVLLPCSLNQFPGSRTISGGWRSEKTELARMNVSSSSGWTWVGVSAPSLLTPLTHTVTNLSVTLRATSLNDSGTYYCHLDFQERQLSQIVRVSIIQVNSTPAGDILVGSNVSLTCNISDSAPGTKIEWWHSNKTQGTRKVKVQGSQTLSVKLTGVTEQYTGEWICQISNNAGELGKAKLTIKIKDVPYSLFGMENVILMIAIPASLLLLVLTSTLTGVCLAKRARRRRRALRRVRHPLCREHSNQLSNQPLCHGNDYVSTDRPLPPLPPYCPHKPRKGRRSQGSSTRRPEPSTSPEPWGQGGQPAPWDPSLHLAAKS